jgi:hypothetical protein
MGEQDSERKPKQRELAEEERDGWASASPEERSKYNGQRDFWKARERQPNAVEQRQVLLRTQGTGFLWEEIEKGLPLSTAALLARKSRKNKQPVADVWAEYQKGSLVRASNGKTFRREVKTKRGERSFASAISLIERAVEEEPMLATLDPFVRTQYVHETLAIIRDSLSDLRSRLYKDNKKSISRQQLLEDCRMFNITPPKPGQPIPKKDMKAGFRRRGEMAGPLHSDRNGGDATKEALFQDITNAFQRLVQYNDQFLIQETPHDQKQEKE